jgi:flavin reductase (DIM6/NTAB) family NADH-FMN oxidoreductase RutF
VSALDDFHAFTAGLDYPMFVVTAAAGDDRDGCLVGFTSQVSIDPARFLVCLSEKNRTYRIARDAPVLAVHALSEGQLELARLFGGETGDETDKLARCTWSTGPGGSVTLDDAPAWFVGEVLDQVVLGDHIGFLLAPTAARGGTGGQELLSFSAAKSIEPGHEA